MTERADDMPTQCIQHISLALALYVLEMSCPRTMHAVELMPPAAADAARIECEHRSVAYNAVTANLRRMLSHVLSVPILPSPFLSRRISLLLTHITNINVCNNNNAHVANSARQAGAAAT